MRVIGLLGLATAGKTTLAEMMAKRIFDDGYGVPSLLSFAGPLKNASAMIGASKERKPHLYRKLCQQIGSALRDPEYLIGYTGLNYFIDLMRERMMELDDDISTERFVIIDDVRFMNEVELVRELGGQLIYCDASKRGVIGDGELYKHESEQLALDYMQGNIPDEVVDWVIPTYDMANTESILHTLLPSITGANTWEYTDGC